MDWSTVIGLKYFQMTYFSHVAVYLKIYVYISACDTSLALCLGLLAVLTEFEIKRTKSLFN